MIDGTLSETRTDRDSLSRLRSLLVLAQLMMESSSEEQIVQLAEGAARALAPCSWARIDLDDPFPVAVSDEGNSVDGINRSHRWTYAVHSGQGQLGWLLAVSEEVLLDDEHFLLRSLAQHAGAAIANRRLHEQELRATHEAERANAQLQQTLEALRRSMEIHTRLAEVAASGEGRGGIANALHELTGLPVAVEDRFGNLRAWAGGDQPSPYPKDSASKRERLLRQAIKAGRPIRVSDKWLGVIQPQPDVIGALVLIDPEGSATEQQLAALESGMTLLAMELARLRSLAESELRVRRDLVEELLGGTDEESAYRRAQALRYDLQRPHRVVVVEGHHAKKDDEAFMHAVRRAARDHPVGTMLARRGSQVVILAEHEADWDAFRAEILCALEGGRCRVGVGLRCESIDAFPASLRQAESALRVQLAAGRTDRATSYEDLGVFQLLAEVQDPTATETFARRWLATLLDYDASRKAEMVRTLGRYLECGGNYDQTAEALFIHRSTLKYRLQRIREISGFDLGDPDTRFNLQLACRAWDTLAAFRSH